MSLLQCLANKLDERAKELYRAGSRDHDDQIVGRALTITYSEIAEMLRSVESAQQSGEQK